MSKLENPEKQLILFRAELIDLCDAADFTIKDSKSPSEFDDIIERFQNFESGYRDVSSAHIDQLEIDKVHGECAEITNDKKRVREKLKKLKQSKPKEMKGQGESDLSLSRATGKVKMPTLPLATFNGDTLKFQSFWDQFKCSVNDNAEFKPVQKFLYLKKSLENAPAALSLIDGYEITDVNYPLAVDRLQHRYGRPRVVVFALMKSILTMSSPGKSTKQLREHHDLLHSRVRSLANLGIDTTNKVARLLLVPVLEMKMRPDFLEEWQRETNDMDDKDVDIEFYFKFMDKQILAKEAVSRASISDRRTSDDVTTIQEPVFQSETYPLASASTLVSPDPTPYYTGQLDQRTNLLVGPPWNSQQFEPLNRPARSQNQTQHQSYFRPRVPNPPGPRYGTLPTQCPFCHQGHDLMNCSQFQNLLLEDRWQWAETSRRCWNCLLPSNVNHKSSTCRKPSCTVEGCGRKHHRLLHNPLTHGMIGKTQKSGPSPIMQTALAIVENGSVPTLVRVLFDTGSQKSYIRTSIVEALSLTPGSVENLTITTLGGGSSARRMSNVNVLLRGYQCQSELVEIRALAIDRICGSLQPCDVDFSMPHLRDLQLADTFPRGSSNVDILVGLDYYYDFVHGGMCRRGPSGSPIALASKFGWILCGPSEGMDAGRQSVSAVVSLSCVSNSELHSSLARFWELESLPTNDDSSAFDDKLHNSVHEDFLRTVSFDGRYTVRIPWRPDVSDLRPNYQIALRRLQQIERQLLYRQPERAQNYCETIAQYVRDGIAEDVSVDNERRDSVATHYFSHHAVYREDKSSTKTRIVMNGSLKNQDGKCLNDYIYSGPALQPDLVSILLRFRTHKIGIVSDIRKMFLQIKLDRRDQDSHRYLWRGLDLSVPPTIFRMTRVTFGVNCSPFLAIATVKHHAHSQASIFPLASRDVLENMFVDDLVSGADNVENSIELVHQLKALMSSGSFELAKWASNSHELMETVAEADRHPSMSKEGSTSLSVLGTSWSIDNDRLSLVVPEVRDTICTKRSTASLVAKVHDPLGIAGPFLVTAKILLQDICRASLSWDDALNEELKTRSLLWQGQLELLKTLSLPRRLPLPIHDGKLEFHGFGDASPKAYGAAIYLRAEYSPGEFQCGLAISKNRVAPLKPVSLPRLELLGAELNCRLMNFVRTSLGRANARIYLWTDSLITYHWIRKAPEVLPKFVGNRVASILDLSKIGQWHYCPGQDNPSDLLTRGVRIEQLLKADDWTNGPRWLTDHNVKWPVLPSENCPESSSTHGLTTTLTVTTAGSNEPVPDVSNATYQSVVDLMDPTRVSTWGKLLRVTTYAQKAIQKFLGILPRASSTTPSTEDLEQAEVNWFLHIQQTHFGGIIDSLLRKRTLAKNDLQSLDPFVDYCTGLLRVGGRLQYSELSDHAKQPIILPHHDWVTRLLVEHHHVKASHAGPDTVHTILRNKYWILHGKREIKNILHRCLQCRRATERPMAQKMAPLPRERTVPDSPFAVVGIDFAGPLYIRANLSQHERSAKKAYICLFTCATSRMIHLELCSDLSTAEFLQAFRRMTNRRGLCHSVISDNALTFKAASRILQGLSKNLDPDKINQFFTTERIQWKFIAERAPWQGGFYERMVQSVKRSLRKVLGKALLTYVELYTVLTDVEAAVNSRPLTVISTDNRDPEPLTPAHLAIGRALLNLPDSTASTALPDTLSRRFRYRQRLIQGYWKRWLEEYLPLLNIRKKWTVERSPLKVGDVVLSSDDNVPRGRWPLAVIEELYPGPDGLVRNVKIRVANGSLLTRPVQRLHLLEQVAESLSDLENSDYRPHVNVGPGEDVPPPKVRRSARLQARVP